MGTWVAREEVLVLALTLAAHALTRAAAGAHSPRSAEPIWLAKNTLSDYIIPKRP